MDINPPRESIGGMPEDLGNGREIISLADQERSESMSEIMKTEIRDPDRFPGFIMSELDLPDRDIESLESIEEIHEILPDRNDSTAGILMRCIGADPDEHSLPIDIPREQR